MLQFAQGPTLEHLESFVVPYVYNESGELWKSEIKIRRLPERSSLKLDGKEGKIWAKR
jgi:hypothetical protein